MHQAQAAYWVPGVTRPCRRTAGPLLYFRALQGLGKTLQCAAFLAGLIESRLIQRAIGEHVVQVFASRRQSLWVCMYERRKPARLQANSQLRPCPARSGNRSGGPQDAAGTVDQGAEDLRAGGRHVRVRRQCWRAVRAQELGRVGSTAEDGVPVVGVGRELSVAGLLALCSEHALDRVVFRRGVLLTTYGMVLHNAEASGSAAHASV